MKRCPVCNRVYEDSQSFCLDDGTTLIKDESSAASQTQVLPRPPKNKFPLIFAGVLVLIAAAIGGWFALASRDGGANQNNKQVSVAQNTPTPAFSPTPAATVQISTPTPAPVVSDEINSNVSTNGNVKTETISNSKPSDEGNAVKTTQPQAPQMKIEDHSVVFDLKQCRKSGVSITCDFAFTNNGEDRRFKLVASYSNLYDELGNGYRGRRGKLANQEGGEPRIDFISGVTTRGQVTFEGIEPNSSKITLLRIQYDVGGDYGLEVKFRNVPLAISK